MLLGQVLRDAGRHPDPVALLAEEPDIVLLARAQAAAAAAGESLGTFVQESVTAFLNGAEEDEWTQLVGYLQDGRLSAAGCLNLMLRRRLAGENGHGAAAT
ncbi:hypothetical protein [Ferruginivarius sediminum]|uniref:Uncharacterized protein n=1 Tax=Ferruginivarius sediminum TaxID=2661937 RepID=A0A369TCI5_9PROT|nr:hypothetical protein [Ferruginivarius sediminum]RDD63043.1 hypothetical protein DRB17_04525 [Ferruginivarius sediminum]